MERRTQYYILFGFAQACGITAIILMFTLIYDNNSLSWTKGNSMYIHFFLMYLGMVYIQGTAISAFRALNAFDRLKVKILHMCLQILVCIMIIIGLVAKFSNSDIHMTSLHSWCGILTVAIFYAQALLGFLGFFWPKFSEEIRKLMMPYHRAIGLLLFTLAIATCVIHINSLGSWSANSGAQARAVWMGLLTVLFGIFTFISVKSGHFRRDNIFD